VVTVCLNAAGTIAAAVQSVADQDWPAVEHVVVDGGSTDGTLQVIERFRPRLAQVLVGPDRGIYDAMNKGLAVATGDVICFLNADDAYVDAGVLRLVAGRMAQQRLDAVFGDVAFFHARAPQRVVRRYRSGRFSPRALAYGWMPAHPALFVRRAVFERHGPFRADYRIAGDFEFIARAFGAGTLRYEYLPQVLVRMQTGGASTAGLRSTWTLNREVLRACRENGIRTNPARILLRYPFKLLELFQK